MFTKLRPADMAVDSANTRVFTVHEALTYLDSVPELIRHEIDDETILWVGEGCETTEWIAIYESIPKRFRIVTEVRFTDFAFSMPEIKTSAAITVHTLAELDEMVKNALLQLSKARKEFAEFTRIQRKADVRNAARQYEV